jgi:hypothetical protein
MKTLRGIEFIWRCDPCPQHVLRFEEGWSGVMWTGTMCIPIDEMWNDHRANFSVASSVYRYDSCRILRYCTRTVGNDVDQHSRPGGPEKLETPNSQHGAAMWDCVESCQLLPVGASALASALKERCMYYDQNPWFRQESLVLGRRRLQ